MCLESSHQLQLDDLFILFSYCQRFSLTEIYCLTIILSGISEILYSYKQLMSWSWVDDPVFHGFGLVILFE